MGRKLYAKGEGFNPSTSIDDVEGLREELDALKGGSGGGGGDNTAIERRLTTAEGEIDDLQRDIAEKSEEIAAVGAKVNTLQGTDEGKSVRTIAAEETAKIVGNAPANYDTLKEIADYIATDATGAAELSNKVNKNTTDIAKVAEDLSATHQLASNAESAISEVVELTIPAIEDELENKLGKTEKAADSAKADSATTATTASRLGGTMYEYRSFTKNDNSGWPMLLLLSECSDLYNGNASAAKQYGFTGIANSSRSEGLVTQDNVVLLTARHGYSSTSTSGRALYTSNSYIEPKVVKYNDKYYVALIVSGSYRTIALVGKFYNPLDGFIKLNYKSASALPTGVEIIQEGNNYFRINALSATKLATPRKIWGQSFDGSGDVDGDMEVNGDVVIKGNVVIEGSVNSGASYQSNPLSTISDGEVPSVEQQLRAQISSLEERIAALEQLIPQNNG